MQACLATAQRQSHVQAIQNKIMEKEIMLHQQHRRELTEAITELKNALASMRREVRQPPLRKHSK